MPSAVTTEGIAVRRHAAKLPEEFAGGQIVAAGVLGAVDDDLRAAVMLDDQRRVPGAALVAFLLPPRRARLRIEDDEGGVFFLVPVEDEIVAVDHRRDASPQPSRVLSRPRSRDHFRFPSKS